MTTTPHRAPTQVELELDLLLSESVSDAERRQAGAFDELPGPVVLFGAGLLGRDVCAAMVAAAVPPIAFCDNKPSLQGTIISGVPVLPTDEAVRRYGATATFVVCVWGNAPFQRFDLIDQQLRDLGCARVVPVGPLLWRHADALLPFWAVDLPSRLLEVADDVRAAFALLSDDDSRRTFVGQVAFRLTGDPRATGEPVEGLQYLRPELMQLHDDEIVVDCGAYDGDTLREWLETQGPFERWYALECDPQNLVALDASLAELPPELAERIDVLPYAAAATAGTVAFTADGTTSSALGTATGHGNGAAGATITVECAPLDELVRGRADRWPTVVKMDIEGGEVDALLGATALLSEGRPVVMLASYHRPNDLWRLPLLLAEVCTDYRFHYRMHKEQGWELVLYAVPAERGVVAGSQA